MEDVYEDDWGGGMMLALAMDFQSFLSICGAISIIGGAGAVIWKVIAPAWNLNKRVVKVEERDGEIFERLKTVEDMQKVQSKCLAAMLDHMITGNGVESMKDVKNELLTSIIDK